MKFKSKNTAPIFYLYCQKNKKNTAPISSVDVHDPVLDSASWVAAVIAIKYKLIAINKILSSSPTNNRPEIPSMQHLRFDLSIHHSVQMIILSDGYVLMGMFNNVGVCLGIFFGGSFLLSIQKLGIVVLLPVQKVQKAQPNYYICWVFTKRYYIISLLL